MFPGSQSERATGMGGGKEEGKMISADFLMGKKTTSLTLTTHSSLSLSLPFTIPAVLLPPNPLFCFTRRPLRSPPLLLLLLSSSSLFPCATMFRMYEKMPTSSNELGTLPKAVMKDRWVVLEKIHGANLSFIVDQAHILTARVRPPNLQLSPTPFLTFSSPPLPPPLPALSFPFMIANRPAPR